MKVKKWMFSNRTKLILTGIALLISVVGTSYAWWTSYVEVKQTISLGKLKLEATFDSLPEEALYEPGFSADFAGTFRNVGSLPTIVKIENTSQIGFVYSDDNWTLRSTTEAVPDTENAVKISMEPASGLYNDPANISVYWFRDIAENRYILLDPGASVDVRVFANLDGEVMGKKYQEASIDLGVQAKATQVIEGALKKEFGISSAELIGMEDSSNRSVNQGKAHLQKLLAR